MPRVISGRFRGLRLAAPKGDGTRPTADKVKEAVFSILSSQGCDIKGAKVLDAFAGSASLGIECLSRGAAKAFFCEQNPASLQVIEHNLSLLKDDSLWRVYKASWPKAMKRVALDAPFNIFFIDPPYSHVFEAVQLLKDLFALAAPAAWAVWEQEAKTIELWQANDVLPWHLVKVQQWGTQSAAFFINGQ